MMVPLRHLRKHVLLVASSALVYNVTDATLSPDWVSLRSMVDNGPAGIIHHLGRIWNADQKEFILVPADLESFPPPLWKTAMTT